jgi:hypothetical protein
MLKKLLLSLLAIIFVTLPVFISPPSARADVIDATLDTVGAAINDKFPDQDKELKEFCNRRKGNQMNLETWYSGKCGGTFEESIGFSSIILLDFYERLAGQRDGDNTLFKIIKEINGLDKGAAGPSKPLNLAQYGLVGSVGNLITKTYSSPAASSIEYIAHVQKNLNNKKIVTEVIAADEGVGFIGLNPILQLWKAVRNIAYFLFVIIFIVIGFAIMFRVKINPQTVIGIQTILPKLVALLLLITFSYAIVGLMVDLMYLVFYLILNLMETNNIVNKENWFVLMASGQWGLALSFILNGFIGGLTGVPAAISVLLGVPLWVGLTNIGTLAIGGWILNVIVLLAIFIAYAKAFLNLIKAYLGIVLKLIFSPIILLGGALPGSTAIGGWFRGLLADLSVFPTTMVCLIIAYLFMIQGILGIVPILNVTNTQTAILGTMEVGGGKILSPPIVSPWGQDASAILALLGLAMLLMMNKYVDMIKDALKVPPFKYGTAVGENLQWGADKSGASRAFKEVSDFAGQRASKGILDRTRTKGGNIGRARDRAGERLKKDNLGG